MIDDTTIIVPTYNNEEHIEHTLLELVRFSKRHRFIQQIIITDNASTDKTLDIILKNIHLLRNPNILLITQPRHKRLKKIIILAIEKANTPNCVIIEPQLYTKPYQIKHQIKLLRRAELILPSRMHPNSIVVLDKMTKKELYYIPQPIMILKVPDITNMNKAFKRDKILRRLKKTKTNDKYWEEIIQEGKIKITEAPTHYNERMYYKK
jgi:glycosyltransferase involved in cell wall biosynthesis